MHTPWGFLPNSVAKTWKVYYRHQEIKRSINRSNFYGAKTLVLSRFAARMDTWKWVTFITYNANLLCFEGKMPALLVFTWLKQCWLVCLFLVSLFVSISISSSIWLSAAFSHFTFKSELRAIYVGCQKLWRPHLMYVSGRSPQSLGSLICKC